MQKFERYCPKCGKLLIYKSKQFLNLSNERNSICKRCHNDKKLKNNCGIILNESLESYYWLGFLMADGHFSKSGNSAAISVRDTDKEHLIKLKNFLGIQVLREFEGKSKWSVGGKMVGISFCSKAVMSQLTSKYKIKSNKTENPPDLSSIKDEKLIAFNIGFIDGDGCISNYFSRKTLRLTIKVHGNWKQNIEYMFKKAAGLSKSGYCVFSIGSQSIIQEYKKFIINNNIPAMNRKWDKVML